MNQFSKYPSKINTSRNNLEEIDLIYFINRIVFFFNKYSKTFIYSLIIGIIASITKIYFEPKIYKSNLVAISNILTLEDVSPIIEHFNHLIFEDNYIEISNLLEIDTSKAKAIIGINVSGQILPLKTKKEENNISTNKFNFNVETTDPTLFRYLNYSLTNMIRKNEYTRLKTSIVLTTNQNLFNRLEQEIKILDSLKRSIYSSINTKNMNIYLTSPSLLNESIIKLYEQQMEIYASLKLNQDILIIEEFAKVNKPTNKNFASFMYKILTITGVIFSITLLFTLTKELLSFIKYDPKFQRA